MTGPLASLHELPQLARWALLYAQAGMPMVPGNWPDVREGKTICSCGEKPCQEDSRNIGKHPIRSLAPNGLLNATASEEVVTEWWTKYPRASIFLRTGKKSEPGEPATGGGIVVLDVDFGVDALGRMKDGFKELEYLTDIVGGLPDTWTAISGSGGRHIYFAHPGGDLLIPNRQHLEFALPKEWDANFFPTDKAKRKLILKALQIRGDGGYIVAPPSRHRSGKRYQWDPELRPGNISLAPLPEALLKVLVRHKGDRPHDDEVPEGAWPEPGDRVRRARAYLEKVQPCVAGDGGDHHLFRTAVMALRGFALPQGVAYDLLMDVFNPRCVPPWPEHRISYKLSQALVAGSVPYGLMFQRDGEMAADKELEFLRKRGSVAAPGELERWAEEEQSSGVHAGLPAESLPDDGGGSGPPALPPAGGGGDDPYEEGRRGGNDGGGRSVHHDFLGGSHVEVAEVVLLNLEEGGRRPMIHHEGKFLHYNDSRGIWESKSELEVSGEIQRYDLNAVGRNKQLTLKNSDVNGIRSQMIVKSICRHASRFDPTRRVPGIAFRNGFLRLDIDVSRSKAQARLVPHSPEHMARHAIDADWSQDPKPAPLMQRFFDVLFIDVKDPEERRKREWLLQEFIGACLAGVATFYARCLYIYGDGGNGKSELLRFARGIFPKEAVCSIPPHEWGVRFQLLPMVDCLANFCDDISARDLIHMETNKKVITGDSIHLDVKQQKPIDFRSVAGHLLSANALPPLTDQTHGAWRRQLALPLTAQIDRRPDLKVPNISAKIIEQELGQVAQWAIEGVLRLVRNGGAYTIPEGTVEAMDDWRKQSDPVTRFMLEMDSKSVAELTKAGGMPSPDLYKLYVAWLQSGPDAAVMQRFQLTRIQFGMRLATTGFVRKAESGGKTWYFATQKFVDVRQRMDNDQQDLEEELEQKKRQHGDTPVIVSTIAPRPKGGAKAD